MFSELPPDPLTLTDGELEPLLQVWKDQKAALEREGVWRSFQQRLIREWIVQNQLLGVAEETLRLVQGERPLTAGYVRDLHAALNGGRTQHQNPEELERLVALQNRYSEQPPEVQAAWLHYALLQVNPFGDQTGLVAAILASLVFLKAGWFPLAIAPGESRYAEALQRADQDDLRPLVSYFAWSQRKALLRAADVAYGADPPQTVEEAIEAARQLVLNADPMPSGMWIRVKDVAQQLRQLAQQRLLEIAKKLTVELGGIRRDYQFSTASASGEMFKELLAKAALPYSPDTGEYNWWLRLTLKTSRIDEILISFHAVGPKYRGLLAVAILVQRDGARNSTVVGEAFQINYREEAARTLDRFWPWLESGLTEALALWVQGLQP